MVEMMDAFEAALLRNLFQCIVRVFDQLSCLLDAITRQVMHRAGVNRLPEPMAKLPVRGTDRPGDSLSVQILPVVLTNEVHGLADGVAGTERGGIFAG